MKRIGKILLVMGCILGIAVCGIGLAMKKQVGRMYEQLDAAAFPEYIAGRELHGNDSYAQIRGGELAALNIEWVP